MDELDYCRLSDCFNLLDAAALIVGEAPSSVCGSDNYYSCEDNITNDYEIDNKFQAVLGALVKAVIKGILPARVIAENNVISHKETLIDVDDIKKWLADKGIRSGFFFPDNRNDIPEYLNPDHPRYAPKLAAAIHAWVTVGNEEKMKGKTPKQALEKELRETAAKFGLTNEDGNPIQAAIEECSKVANWNPGGGAPKTP